MVKDTSDEKKNPKEIPNATPEVKKERPVEIIYIYKLKNKKLKSKFWYHPNEQMKPLDFYLERGWRVVKMKKLDSPPLMEKLIAWGQVIIPMIKETLKKNPDNN